MNKKDFDVFTAIQIGPEIKTKGGKIIEVFEQLGSKKICGPIELLNTGKNSSKQINLG